jgi:hypothetical protein
MNLTVKVTFEDDDGEEQTIELPGKHAVCGNCDGHGTHLRPGMREHAYTQEEFDESFHDDEDRAAYFERGGMYDVQCETCKGLRVVVVVDRGAIVTPEHHEGLRRMRAREKSDREYEALCESERRMGC